MYVHNVLGVLSQAFYNRWNVTLVFITLADVDGFAHFEVKHNWNEWPIFPMCHIVDFSEHFDLRKKVIILGKLKTSFK